MANKRKIFIEVLGRTNDDDLWHKKALQEMALTDCEAYLTVEPKKDSDEINTFVHKLRKILKKISLVFF